MYIGAAVVLTLFLRHWPGGRHDLSRAMTSFALVTALLLSPYLLFIQVHGGLSAYLGTGLEFSRNEAARNARVLPTWTYDLRDPSRATALSMLDDPDIEDIQGIDRATGGRVAPRAGPASRSVFFEDVGSLISSNALPWLFYLFWAMPLAAIGVLVCRRARAPLSLAVMPGETEKILVLALLALCVNFGMLRDPLPARISDVAGITPIVGAWLMGLAFGGLGSIPRRLHGWWAAGAAPGLVASARAGGKGGWSRRGCRSRADRDVRKCLERRGVADLVRPYRVGSRGLSCTHQDAHHRGIPPSLDFSTRGRVGAT